MGYVHCRRQCVEARSAYLYISREARKIFFTVIFQLPGWGLVAPSCFALHCHCCLVSVQSVTVSLSARRGKEMYAALEPTPTNYKATSFHFLAPPLSISHVVVSTLLFTIVLNKRPVRVQTLQVLLLDS